MSHGSSPGSQGKAEPEREADRADQWDPSPLTRKPSLRSVVFPSANYFPHNLRDADRPPGGRNPGLSLHSPAGKCLQKTWVGWGGSEKMLCSEHPQLY